MAFQRRSKPPAKPLTADELLARLEHYCAYQERCPKEVKQKLTDLGADNATARQIFNVLQEEGFFNENRFTESFVRGKFLGARWGKIRIRLELRMRDIDPELIETALAGIDDETYRHTINSLLDKKLPPNADYDVRKKAAASLIRAGFEPHLVFEALRQKGTEMEEE